MSNDIAIAIMRSEVSAYGGNAAVLLQQIRWWREFRDEEWFTGTLGELAELTGLTEKQVRTATTKLVEGGALEKRKLNTSRGDHTCSYRPSAQTGICNSTDPSAQTGISTSAQTGNSGSAQTGTSASITDIEEMRDSSSSSTPAEPEADEGDWKTHPDLEEARRLTDLLLAVSADFRGTGRRKLTKAAVRDMDLLLRRGPVGLEDPIKVPPDHVEKVVEGVFTLLATTSGNSTFCWADQIQSPGNLRKHWERLIVELKKAKGVKGNEENKRALVDGMLALIEGESN